MPAPKSLKIRAQVTDPESILLGDSAAIVCLSEYTTPFLGCFVEVDRHCT
jgi:hypothetical protein